MHKYLLKLCPLLRLVPLCNVFSYSLESLFFLVQVLLLQVSFLSACTVFTFSLCAPLHLRWVSCRQYIIWVVLFYPVSHPIPLMGAFSPFTFKVITGRYVLTVIHCFLVGFVILLYSSPDLFSCSLVVFFSVTFGLLSLYLLCIS